MASKAQWRNTEAQKLTLDLIDLGHIRKNEKVAGKLLALACIRAEERTRTTKKPAYEGVQFNFETPLEMAIYIITELPKEWEHCKELKVLWQQAKGKTAKALYVPTIDRIKEGTEGNRGHYERGNIQILSNEANRAKSAEKKMKPVIVFDTDTGKVITHRSQTVFQKAENVSPYQVQKMNKAFQADKALRG